MELPKISQTTIKHVDATPDAEYPLRILRAYRENCNCKWKTTPPDPFYDSMNEDQDRRAEILDAAIRVLEKTALAIFRDAMRYRFLRDYANPDEGHPYISRHIYSDWGKWFNTHDSCGEADNLIDALIDASQPDVENDGPSPCLFAGECVYKWGDDHCGACEFNRAVYGH